MKLLLNRYKLMHTLCILLILESLDQRERFINFCLRSLSSKMTWIFKKPNFIVSTKLHFLDYHIRFLVDKKLQIIANMNRTFESSRVQNNIFMSFVENQFYKIITLSLSELYLIYFKYKCFWFFLPDSLSNNFKI